MDLKTIREAHSACGDDCDVAPVFAALGELRAEVDRLKAELRLEQESRISRRLYEQDTEVLRHDRNVWKNRYDASAAEVERLKAIAKGNGDDSLHFARRADDIATQLRELREAVEAVRDGANCQLDVSDCLAYVDNEALKALFSKVTP